MPGTQRLYINITVQDQFVLKIVPTLLHLRRLNMIEIGHSTDPQLTVQFSAKIGGDLVVMASNIGGKQFIIGATKAGVRTDTSWVCTDVRTKDTNPDDWSPAVEMGPDKYDEFDKFSNCPAAQRPCAKRIWAQNDPETGLPPAEIVCTKRQGIPSTGEQQLPEKSISTICRN